MDDRTLGFGGGSMVVMAVWGLQEIYKKSRWVSLLRMTLPHISK